jgi:hypothetical protein
MDTKKIGMWLFIIAFLGAIITGLLEYGNVMEPAAWIPWTFVALGLMIGVMNITPAEAPSFLIAVVALGVASGVLALLPSVGGWLEAVFMRIAALSLPIAIPPAIKIFVEKAMKR